MHWSEAILPDIQGISKEHLLFIWPIRKGSEAPKKIFKEEILHAFWCYKTKHEYVTDYWTESLETRFLGPDLKLQWPTVPVHPRWRDFPGSGTFSAKMKTVLGKSGWEVNHKPQGGSTSAGCWHMAKIKGKGRGQGDQRSPGPFSSNLLRPYCHIYTIFVQMVYCIP